MGNKIKQEEINGNNLVYTYAGDEILFGCPQCDDILRKLYEENKMLKQTLEYNQQNSNQIKQFYDVSPVQLSLRRLPALVVTLILEMLGGLIINQLEDVIRALTLIVSFMPAISALSGNLGLQASANTIRGLATGHITPKSYGSNILKEIKSGLISATFVAVVMSTIGTTWTYFDQDSLINKQNLNTTFVPDPPSPAMLYNGVQGVYSSLSNSTQMYINQSIHSSFLETSNVSGIDFENIQEISQNTSSTCFLFGGVLFVGTWISMMVSTVNGASTPILATILQIDPAKIAGPLETAFQDIVGQSFLLGLSYMAFHHIQHLI
ncbi:uncharacterized protein LOC111703346 [Eurytemora carolleeae]|uniref:uncharacterized protein LOC111703346 n=1 Tax=Eurytemora carolleeae TaxID=1294199 RepID=UPI000C78DB02|nr:uncharacterized protein LOC111703346 [Eurytemora carolleeae]|eukprot:XP_023331015.1 uncharacterized protein LOC111703346 [Eurytemora affinis]